MTRRNVPGSIVISLAALAALACSACGGGGGGGDGASGAPGDEVVAYIGEDTITMAELEERAKPELVKLEIEKYEKMREVLDQMTLERVIVKEAEEIGLTPEELIAAETTDKVSDPSEEEIERFYKRNQERMGNRPLEEMREAIVQTIRNNKATAYREQYFIKLKHSKGLRVVFDPPRAEVEPLADELARGDENAPVTIVEYADFECPYCKRLHTTMERLLVEYGERVRFVYRDFPLVIHARAVPAAQAARCAQEQDKFWDYYQHLMAIRGDLDDENLVERARDVGLDADAFAACYEAKQHDELIRASIDSGRELGVQATPTLFVNGRRVIGSKSYEELKEIIEDELARSEPMDNVGG
jgi:protein-disulfide isomerase